VTIDLDDAFRTALVGKPCTVVLREHDWDFAFGPANGIAVSVPWRLVGGEAIALTDCDHDQLFGLPKPVNAEARANELLSGAVVQGVQTDAVTADLRIWFSNGLRLELFNNSTGYEGWQAVLGGHTIVAMGGGGFSVF